MEFILTIAAIHLVACLSPGPDIFLVVLNSMRHGWRTGVATTFGILCGVSLHISLGLTGVSYLITRGEVFERVLSLAGGSWLIYLGLKGFMSCRRLAAEAREPDQVPSSPDALPFHDAWTQGFFVNVLNPKAMLFFLSLFSVMLGPDLPLEIRIASGGVMVCVQAVAFSLVAFLVDRPRFKSSWNRLQLCLELGISVILLVLGLWIWITSIISLLN
ncbi:LysE family transporter [Puniceicoccales bacterium CK1056]|uniref:LysE family transporter n=1 Tax=Oceanipulchritudo coccoides TaxID=2706888 RepID=A0A6B2M4W3_9BACT|nr:LysE family transporter [Oceanipulchritudo coccoides]NDV63124.1 LysE family transporter [Oceanipulchritudo coccoides]